MSLQVVNGDQGLFMDECDRLGGDQADDDPADQPRPGRGRHPIEGAEVAAGLRHGGRDDEIERLHMGARCDFRNHPAECRMFGDLRQHHIGENRGAAVVVALHHRSRRLVAGRLYTEHKHG